MTGTQKTHRRPHSARHLARVFAYFHGFNGKAPPLHFARKVSRARAYVEQSSFLAAQGFHHQVCLAPQHYRAHRVVRAVEESFAYVGV